MTLSGQSRASIRSIGHGRQITGVQEVRDELEVRTCATPQFDKDQIMHVKKILFATDFSTTANQALDYAATLAKQNGPSR